VLQLFTKHGKLPKNVIIITEALKLPNAVRIVRITDFIVHEPQVWHINNVLRSKNTHKIIDRR
jgi:hypothetical protein